MVLRQPTSTGRRTLELWDPSPVELALCLGGSCPQLSSASQTRAGKRFQPFGQSLRGPPIPVLFVCLADCVLKTCTKTGSTCIHEQQPCQHSSSSSLRVAASSSQGQTCRTATQLLSSCTPHSPGGHTPEHSQKPLPPLPTRANRRMNVLLRSQAALWK